MNLEGLPDDLLELMEAVACGDRALDDPLVVARRHDDARFAAWLDEWQHTVAQLHAAAEMEREVVAASEHRGVGPARASGTSGGAHEALRQPRRGAARVWLLAAVLLVCATIWFWPFAGSGDGADRRLGGDFQISFVDAHGFAFDQPLPEQGYYSIEVAERDASEPWLRVERWFEPAWQPDRSSWPPVVVVRVFAHNRSGDVFKEGWIEVP